MDDDEDVRTLAGWQLEAEGFRVTAVSDGQAALSAVERDRPDLVLLDLTLPLLAGLDVLTHIRRSGNLPVIVVSGRTGETDRIIGLDLGADDYVMKPFSPAELAARVRSVLRRSGRQDGSEGDAEQVPQAPGRPPEREMRELVVDRVTRTVTARGRFVDLAAREFDLLAFLSDAPRRVFTRAQLLEHVWHSSSDWQEPATVTQHVHRLRRKLEQDPYKPRWLRTVRGVGYKFEP
ncbi:response regulator transcription factor [Streptomyces sp. NPDC047515]|uniref:response regulator transcription factor n=1 Tax=Streptomyces sp. NPDC047515 TaxID=3155380 RepID=UPI0033DDC396